MPAKLLGNTLTVLHRLANSGDKVAVGVLAILQGTHWVDNTQGTEAANVRLISLQIRDQAGQAIKAATEVVIEAFADAGTSLTAARLATTAALPTCTAAGTGVGKTLTATANAALTVDSVAVAASDRILVKNQAAPADNGIYVVTATGSAGAPFVLTRATDFDQSTETLEGLQIPVTAGTVNTGHTFVFTTSGAVVLETTGLTFADLTTFTVADLRGITAGGTGTLKVGSATSKVWMTSDATGAFSLNLKNVLIGNVLLKMTTDNGETEEVLVAFA